MTQLAYVRVGIDRLVDLPDGRFVIGVVADGAEPASADVIDLRRIDVRAGRHIRHGPGGRRLRADGPERSIATVVRAATPLGRAEAADALRVWRSDADKGREWVAAALAVVNRAIRAHRIVGRDAYAIELTTEDLWMARLGVADPTTLGAGRAGEELDVLPSRRRRESAGERARSGEVVAEAFSGRLVLLEGEELLAMAAREASQGRLRSAAAAAGAAGPLLLAELGGQAADVAEVVGGLQGDPRSAEALIAAVAAVQAAIDDWRRDDAAALGTPTLSATSR